MRCWKCDMEIDEPTVSVYVEFEDGTDYSELVMELEEEETMEYIEELIEENEWTNIKEKSYGLYCPYCLNSVD